LLELQFDHEGNLWLLARCGLIKIDRGEIRGWASGSVSTVHPQLFGASDGVRAMSTYYLPHSGVASDGRLWFGGDAGVQVVDPSSIRMNTIPPPVHIEKLVVDGVVYTAGARLRPLPHNVEIDYTALSLVSPSQVRFRYRLIGSEKQWQDAQTRRQAFYQNLKPGSYRFELVACNNDGVWNQVGDAVTFSIPPAFYQTAWFRCVLLCLILTIGWIVIRLRELHAANEIEAKMGERLMERDRIARELHDTLLQGFQSIVFRFQTAWKMTPHDELADSVMTDTLARADAVLKDGRAKVRDLRGEEIGQALSNELREFIAWQVPPSGLVSSVNTIGEARPLNEVVREEVAAVAKEAIANALMHSNATSLVCELNFGKKVFTITCSDNGVGIPSEITSQGRSGHYGLLGMKERAERMGGSLRIGGGTPSGTVVRLQITGRLAYKREVVDTQAGLLNRLLARAAKRFR
jgi:signal transduction histidine kinase